jgi:hypothetical protein
VMRFLLIWHFVLFLFSIWRCPQFQIQKQIGTNEQSNILLLRKLARSCLIHWQLEDCAQTYCAAETEIG